MPSPTMARFEWEVSYIKREIKGYQVLEGTEFAPRFLGLHDQGRIIGILLEKTDGRFAGIDDLDEAELEAEMASLEGQPREDAGRGGQAVFIEDD